MTCICICMYIYFFMTFISYIYLYAQIYIYWDLHFKAIKWNSVVWLYISVSCLSLSIDAWDSSTLESVAVAPSFSLLQSIASSEYATAYLSIQWLTWLVLMVSCQQDCDEFSSQSITVYFKPASLWDVCLRVELLGQCTMPALSARCLSHVWSCL